MASSVQVPRRLPPATNVFSLTIGNSAPVRQTFKRKTDPDSSSVCIEASSVTTPIMAISLTLMAAVSMLNGEGQKLKETEQSRKKLK